MTSKSFNKSKRLRSKSKCVQKEIRFIKQSRARTIRRRVRSLLKHQPSNVGHVRYINDGSWKIV